MKTYFLYKETYYCLINENGRNFNDGTSIVKVSVSDKSVTRIFFSDLQKRVEQGESEYTSIVPFVSKFNEVEMQGQKIDSKAFYKAVRSVLPNY